MKTLNCSTCNAQVKVADNAVQVLCSLCTHNLSCSQKELNSDTSQELKLKALNSVTTW